MCVLSGLDGISWKQAPPSSEGLTPVPRAAAAHDIHKLSEYSQRPPSATSVGETRGLPSCFGVTTHSYINISCVFLMALKALSQFSTEKQTLGRGFYTWLPVPSQTPKQEAFACLYTHYTALPLQS